MPANLASSSSCPESLPLYLPSAVHTQQSMWRPPNVVECSSMIIFRQ
jgi:hypothetical protein